MVIHHNVFREELYIEHLEEAAFQYETRLNWLYDEEVGWHDLENIDAALEAHIDALIVGSTLALKVCLGHIEEADASVLHVIVRVFCRHQLIDRLSKLWVSFDFENEDKVRAVADALKWECPQDWFPSLMRVFSSSRAEMYPVLAPSVASLSRKNGECLAAALTSSKAEHIASQIFSISRCDRSTKKACIPLLAPYIKHDDIDVVKNAALALMMMGERRTLTQCSDRLMEFPVLFALGGNAKSIDPLLEQASRGEADTESLLALGVAGLVSAVTHLLAYLKHPHYGVTAALSLHLISGARLYEDVFIEDEVQEDELFEFEVEAFKNGELPRNIDGNPYGVEVKKLSLDQALWYQWFKDNNHLFISGVRYRNGKSLSTAQLLINILDNQTDYKIRNLAYEELVIRYGLELPFASDDLIYKQKEQINHIHAWIENTKSSFHAGRWYFDGQELF